MFVRCVFSIIIVSGIIICLTIYPLALGGIVLVMRLLIFIVIRMYYRVLFGAILLLVFVGGLLVAFGYAIALAPNPMFVFKVQIMFSFGVLAVIIRITVVLIIIGLIIHVELYTHEEISIMSEGIQRDCSAEAGLS